jgi:hypothetical protein
MNEMCPCSPLLFNVDDTVAIFVLFYRYTDLMADGGTYFVLPLGSNLRHRGPKLAANSFCQA